MASAPPGGSIGTGRALPIVGNTKSWAVEDARGGKHVVRAEDVAIGDRTAIFMTGQPPNVSVVASFVHFTSIIEKPGGVA